jgi:hypothetical protein
VIQEIIGSASLKEMAEKLEKNPMPLSFEGSRNTYSGRDIAVLLRLIIAGEETIDIIPRSDGLRQRVHELWMIEEAKKKIDSQQ